MEAEEMETLLMQNNYLIAELLKEVRTMKSQLVQPEVDECTPLEALHILGFKNPRYLKYFYDHKLLDRRKGLSGYLYYKSQCKALAQKFKTKAVPVPKQGDLYARA